MSDKKLTNYFDDNNELTSLVCKQCGSNDVEYVSERYVKCKQCGTKMMIPKKATINVNNNEIHIHESKSKKSKTNDLEVEDKVVIIENEKSNEEDFFRRSLVYLCSLDSVPTDILESKFEPVEKQDALYHLVEAEFNMNYTASSGYNREEEYLAVDKVFDRDLGRTIEKEVMKKRVVTDWRPWSFNETVNRSVVFGDNDRIVSESYAKIENADTAEGDYFIDYIRGDGKDCEENSKSSVVAEHNFKQAANSQINEQLKRREILLAVNAKGKVPGDVVKDFRHSGSFSVKDVTSYSVQQYHMDYKYKNDKYETFGFLNSKDVHQFKRPDDSKENAKKFEEKVQPLRTLSIVSLICFMIFIIATLNDGMNKVLLGVFMAILVILYALPYIVTSVLEKKTKNKNKLELIDKLNDFLSKKGMKLLTTEEKETIGGKHDKNK